MARTTLTGDQVRDDSITGDDVDESTLIITELKDADGDTKIQIEESADEDKIRFDTAGVERMVINDSGQVGIDTNSPAATFHVHGDTKVSPNGTETKIALKGDTTLTAVLEDTSFAGLGTADFTVSFWWYANDTNSDPILSNSQILFYDGSSLRHQLQLKTPDVKIYFENDASSNDYADFDTNFVEGNWYHIIAQFDVGDLSSGEPKLWLNGVEISGTGYSAVGGTATEITKVKVYLDDGGAMQDLVFWNKLLSTQEISELYNDGFYVDPSKLLSIKGNIVSWFKLGYEDLWAAGGFSSGDSISGTVNIPDDVGTNEFTMTTESEFSLMDRTVNKRTVSDFYLDSTSLEGIVVVKDSLEVNFKSDLKGSVHYALRDVNSTSTVQDTDYCLRCIQTSAITITLPAKASSAGRVLVFKDVLGNAGSNNITIDGDGSDQIDGAATFVLNQNRQSLTIVCDGINGWMITGMYIP